MKKNLFALLAVPVLALLGACSSGPQPVEFTVEMTEFAFSPNTIEVQVGQEVVIHISNEGALTHELMIGRELIMHDNLPDTYEHNLFEKQGPVMSGGSDGHDMDSMTGDGDHGFMVLIPKDGEAMTMTFTVTEDMVGEWEIGCFSDLGSHYTQGMVGKFIVTP